MRKILHFIHVAIHFWVNLSHFCIIQKKRASSSVPILKVQKLPNLLVSAVHIV